MAFGAGAEWRAYKFELVCGTPSTPRKVFWRPKPGFATQAESFYVAVLRGSCGIASVIRQIRWRSQLA